VRVRFVARTMSTLRTITQNEIIRALVTVCLIQCTWQVQLMIQPAQQRERLGGYAQFYNREAARKYAVFLRHTASIAAKSSTAMRGVALAWRQASAKRWALFG